MPKKPTAKNGSDASVRVMVAGIGAITAEGPTAADLWYGVVNAKVAISRVRQMPMQGFGTRVGGEVIDVLPNADYRRPPDHREPAIDFALVAAEEAVRDAGIPPDTVPPERWGLVVGTCNGGLESAEVWYMRDIAWDSNEPETLLLAPPQAMAEALGAAFQVKGPVLSINTACAAGNNAIGLGAELIRSGQADVVIAGGADALSQVVFAGFTALESLSPAAAAPYSRSRQGLSLGEGSGMVVLATDEVCRRVGRQPLAELRGYGLSADGYHPTAPHPEGEGAARAIKAALEAAGVEPAQVHYVNGHGTGTPKNDSAESNAIRLALGDAADTVMVSSTKSMIGHLLGAAGAVEAVVTIEAIRNQIAPPTANFDEDDPDCPLDYVPNVARQARIDVAISNNFAFGGNNACLVFARPGALDRPPPRPQLDRVVVTGMAATTPAGDLAAALAAVEADRAVLAAEGRARVGRVTIDADGLLTPRDMRRMDRLSILSVTTAKRALADAGITIDEANRARVGLIFGTGIGPMDTMEAFGRPLLAEGPEAANPAIFPNTVYNAAAGQVAIHTGTVGPTSTVTTGHAAGAAALCYGSAIASDGRADAVLCLACDTLTDTIVRIYGSLGLFASDHSFGLSEGAAAVVVERLSKARERGAAIRGEVLGWAITSDARGVASFDIRGRGLERAIRLATQRAAVELDDIAEVWTGLCGHRTADAAEEAALRRLFKSPITLRRPKKTLGEPIGVGGLLSAALAFTGSEPGGRRLALLNSSSLGGTHVAVIAVLGGLR